MTDTATGMVNDWRDWILPPGMIGVVPDRQETQRTVETDSGLEVIHLPDAQTDERQQMVGTVVNMGAMNHERRAQLDFRGHQLAIGDRVMFSYARLHTSFYNNRMIDADATWVMVGTDGVLGVLKGTKHEDVG